jgi:GNAT superfamily N-acetyltransferase
MIIRKIRKGDLSRTISMVLDTCEKSVFPTFSENGINEFRRRLERISIKLADRRYIGFVADDNGRIIGMVSGSIRDSYASFGLLFVDRKHYGKGIGRKLAERLELAFMKSRSTVKVHSSLNSIGFYERIGYKKTTGVRSKNGIVFQPMKKNL